MSLAPRVHAYPTREVPHQGSTPCAVQVLGGTGQDPDMGPDKLFSVPLVSRETAATASASCILGHQNLAGRSVGRVQFFQGTFPLLSLLLSMSKFLPVHFPKLLHQELQKARWRAETGRDYCQGKQWFKAILSFVETIYFGFVAPRKRRASFCLHHRICLVLGGRYGSVADKGCTQPSGHCGAFCLLLAPTVTCRVL